MGRFKYENRSLIYDRDKGKCQYCGKHLSFINMTIDHKIPISILKKIRNLKEQTQEEYLNNLFCCCDKCNHFKGDATVEEFRQKCLERNFLVKQGIVIFYFEIYEG